MRAKPTTVNIKRDKLIEELTKARDERVKELEKKQKNSAAKEERQKQAILSAAKLDLSKEENFKKLRDACHSYHFSSGSYTMEIKNIKVMYGKAIRLVTISSDETFSISAHTEFAYLLGMSSW